MRGSLSGVLIAHPLCGLCPGSAADAHDSAPLDPTVDEVVEGGGQGVEPDRARHRRELAGLEVGGQTIPDALACGKAHISSKGYDLDILNQCEFKSETFSWNFDNPTLINGYADVNMLSNNSEILNVYYQRYGAIKQSLTFSLDYAGFKGGMSFDIFSYNDYLYDTKTIETFNTFHRLIMSYMNMGSLYIESSRIKNDIILSMVKTLGFYDDYTKSHSINVSEWTNKVCDELKIDHKMKEQAYYASIVHDIGKIGIRSDILNKKSRLTDAEYDLVKNHTVKGYNILSEVQNLSEIAVIVRHHHERWDGYGYPDGLSGEDIPYLSQVIGVCDSVSAMLSKRVYQDAKTIEEVIKELKAQRGKQFSPIPCDAMIKILEEETKK